MLSQSRLMAKLSSIRRKGLTGTRIVRLLVLGPFFLSSCAPVVLLLPGLGTSSGASSVAASSTTASSAAASSATVSGTSLSAVAFSSAMVSGTSLFAAALLRDPSNPLLGSPPYLPAPSDLALEGRPSDEQSWLGTGSEMAWEMLKAGSEKFAIQESLEWLGGLTPELAPLAELAPWVPWAGTAYLLWSVHSGERDQANWQQARTIPIGKDLVWKAAPSTDPSLSVAPPNNPNDLYGLELGFKGAGPK